MAGRKYHSEARPRLAIIAAGALLAVLVLLAATSGLAQLGVLIIGVFLLAGLLRYG